MSGSENFQISATNPNESVGGGGCVCGDAKQQGCEGPYAVFFATETDSNLSPHVVLGLSCAEAVVRKAQAAKETGDLVAAGEPVITVDDAELIETSLPRHENPVAEGEYPDLDADDELI